jgi:hypothetical protein
MKTQCTLSLLLASAILALAPTARAEGPQAADFFDAGAQAYKSGQYLVAAEAFLKANEIAPSPALLFSAAQSFRRQFLAEPAPQPLLRAVALYREYLRLDKAPRRREDAMQALATLAPFEVRYAGAEGAKEPEPAKAATRLLITASAEGAEVSIDGGAFVAAPATVRVPAGPHAVRLRALGYTDEQLTVQAVESELSPRHVVLRPRPARLEITGTRGASVSVDGQLRATLPLGGPLALEPGAHFVAVTLTGHAPQGSVVELARDGSAQIAADLRPTRQRVLALGTLSVGAAGLLTGGALGGVALVRQGEARSIEAARAKAPIDAASRDRYNAALKARDDLARAAVITGGLSVLALGAGLGLFAVDRSEIAPPSDERLRAPARPGPKVELEIGALSIGVRGSF